MLSTLLLPLLACPPTTLPPVGRGRDQHVLTAVGSESPGDWDPPAGVYAIHSGAGLPVLPSYPRELPLWDPAASLAEVVADSDDADAPGSTPWVAWALAEAAGEVSHPHLHAALTSADLRPEILAWWRGVTPNPTRSLRDALADADDPGTRALLSTSVALTELERSCPVALALDGSCRAPDSSDLLLRRDPIALARGQAWTEEARRRWAELDLAAQAPVARAQLGALELGASAAEYEGGLAVRLPSDLEFTIDEWRRDSGVREWEAEYARQAEIVEASKDQAFTLIRTSEACRREQTEAFARLRDAELLDHRNFGVVLLRSAGSLLALAELSDAQATRPYGAVLPPAAAPSSGLASDLQEQAAGELERCLALARSAGDGALHDACLATLERIAWTDEPPLRELYDQPRASSSVIGVGVLAPE